VTFKVLDSTDGTPDTGYVFNTTGVDFWYREGATGAVDTFTAVTQRVTGAHVDYGLVHVQDGVGRLDLPDSVATSGVDYIEYGGTFTDMIVIGGVIELEGASAAAVRTFTEATFITDTVVNASGNNGTTVDLQDFLDAQAADNSTAGELWLWQDADGGLEYFRVVSMASLVATVESWPAGGSLPGGESVAATDKLWRVGYVDMNTVAISDTQQTAGDVPALVTTVDTVVDGIQTDLSNGTDGLGAIKTDTAAILVDTGTTIPNTLGTPAGASMSADIAAVKSDTAGIQTDLSNGTDGLGAIKTDTAAILVDTAILGSPAGASMSADIAAVKSDTAAILQDTGTDIPASITTIDTVVDAVKAKTDNLVFTVANQVDANVESVNTQVITGDGSVGNEFQGA